MLADELDYVIGVDTHRDEHVAGGRRRAGRRCCRGGGGASQQARLPETLRFAERHAPGGRVWAIEGTGSYGAGLARFLAEPRRDGARGQPHSREPSGGCAAKTTRSTRSGRARCTRQRHARAAASRASGAKRCGCCWSPAAAPSTSAARHSRSCAA